MTDEEPLSIEELVFENTSFDEEKLIAYGFQKERDTFTLSVPFHENEFLAMLAICRNHVEGKVMDCAMEEEYLPLRVSFQSNAFAHQIREEYTAILQSIKKECACSGQSKEADHITKAMLEVYSDKLEAPFEEDDSLVLRAPNQKWYALFMRIPRNKLEPKAGKESIAIVNLKADPNDIPKLICEKGIYPSYHMNKKYWISVILDENVKEERLFALVQQSRSLVMKKGGVNLSGSVVIPSKPSTYDIETPLDTKGELLWHQDMHVRAGTVVYIYMASPVSAIVYKTIVKECDIRTEWGTGMLLEKIDKYPKNLFTIQILRQFGCTSIRGARRLPEKVSQLIESTTKNTHLW